MNPIKPTDFTSDTATEYKSKIDMSLAGLVASIGQFAPQARDTPDMSFNINAGLIPQQYHPRYTITKLQDLIIPATNISGIGAPSSGKKQLHVISFNWETFSYVRHYTSEFASTLAVTDYPFPSVPASNMVICAVVIDSTSTKITDDMITDLRSLFKPDFIYSDGAGGNVIITNKNGVQTISISAFSGITKMSIPVSTGYIEFEDSTGAPVARLLHNGNLLLKGTVTSNNTTW